ncbi:efflux RND transporter periplasmic adaptor subunit [Helicovermis profundi]|uniref:Efflux RND transporter periplasmic adaptor subunit n=1 Tax=Helicovermis profundi TaxID=3065157 RepID=A0AAU9E7D6_9FIRM|nr:efflux RND transporter periplasmic adaptor subunit [Clostridia bacterium S502]
MKLKNISIFILIIVISFSFASCTKNDEKDAIPKEISTSTKEAIHVKTEKIAYKDFNTNLSITSVVVPKDSAYISSKSSGIVKDIYFDVGSNIKVNDELIKLDDENLIVQKNKILLSIKIARFNLENNKKDLNDYKALYEKGAVTKKNLQALENKYKASEFSLESAKYDFDSLQLAIKNTSIKSPIDGIVTEKNIASGESINPGTRCFKIIDISSVYSSAGVSESFINNIKKGQEVKVTSADTGKVYSGVIASINPEMNPLTKKYDIKVLIDNSDLNLKPGMSTVLSFDVNKTLKVLSVNKLSLILIDSKNYVFINDNGTAKKTEITIGNSTDNYYEVLSGLNANSEVVTSGSGLLKDGDLIVVEK